MEKKILIKEIEKWIEDLKAIIDVKELNEHTFEGSAYSLFSKALIELKKHTKKEYLVVGDNNFWYASCLKSLGEAEQQVKEIKKEGNNGYSCALCNQKPCCEPETLYIYEAKEIKEL